MSEPVAEIARSVVAWLMLEDNGIRFARASGVPTPVIEGYGFSPQLRY